MGLPPFLADAPSHFNWRLDIDTSKDFEALNLQIKEHLEYNPKSMTIQALLFQSYLYMSTYKDPKPDLAKSKECLRKAYEEINKLDDEERNGYLTVAKSNEAHMAFRLGKQDLDLEKEIKSLIAAKTDNSQACIDSVRAFALSRIGMRKYIEAKHYYQEALRVQPDNTQCLFGLALVIGRYGRFRDGLTYTKDLEEERNLYQKILAIDKNHALAHVALAFNLFLKREQAVAVKHAYKARELQPQNPHILGRAGKVIRKAGFPDAALKVLEEGTAIGSKTDLFHQMGLAYRDKYNEQNRKKKEAIEKKSHYDQPDKGLLRAAIVSFTKALESNSTNNMALLDRAMTHERLRMMEEADTDFLSALTTKNLDCINKVTINIKYALFLERSYHDEDKAAEHFQIAIDFAVNDCNCTEVPISRDNPEPKFCGSIKKDMRTAIWRYSEIMQRKADSDSNDCHSKGLKGLAWLHQALGQHDAARDEYEEYLDCDGKHHDDDAIYHLVKSLIWLGCFEEARKRIKELKTLQKSDMADKCTIECALQQGEMVLTQENQVGLAKQLFREAVEIGSIEGCHKLADILKKQPDVSTQEFRMDCAKILHICEKNKQSNLSLYTDIMNLMDLCHGVYGKLRNRHRRLELSILQIGGQGITREILDNASQVIYEARSMLDRVMIKFQQKHYPARQTSQCTFFYVQQELSNMQKTEQQVKNEILKRLKSYKWVQFVTTFPDLFDFLVKMQPAYPGNTDNWYLALSQLAIRDKHLETIQHSQYHIPVILNGQTRVTPVPVGSPVFGTTNVSRGQIQGVDYELFAVVDVARKAALEVESIVGEFHKHL